MKCKSKRARGKPTSLELAGCDEKHLGLLASAVCCNPRALLDALPIRASPNATNIISELDSMTYP